MGLRRVVLEVPWPPFILISPVRVLDLWPHGVKHGLSVPHGLSTFYWHAKWVQKRPGWGLVRAQSHGKWAGLLKSAVQPCGVCQKETLLAPCQFNLLIHTDRCTFLHLYMYSTVQKFGTKKIFWKKILVALYNKVYNNIT